MLSKLALNLDLPLPEIRRRRSLVAHRVMVESSALRDVDFDTINTRDLFELFSTYDELFFEGLLSPIFESRDYRLKFRLSSRMTSTGGMTTFHKTRSGKSTGMQAGDGRHFEIAVSSTLLFNTSFDKKLVKVGGVFVEHRLDALQRIFEHELVHLLEMLLWEDSSCARSRFKSIVKRFFGHLESNHQLLTPTDTAKSEFGIATGDTVQFHYRGRCIQGIVNGIHRRATVLVPDRDSGQVYDDDRRYRRFYVPLDRLSRVVRSA